MKSSINFPTLENKTHVQSRKELHGGKQAMEGRDRGERWRETERWRWAFIFLTESSSVYEWLFMEMKPPDRDRLEQWMRLFEFPNDFLLCLMYCSIAVQIHSRCIAFAFFKSTRGHIFPCKRISLQVFNRGVLTKGPEQNLVFLHLPAKNAKSSINLTLKESFHESFRNERLVHQH